MLLKESKEQTNICSKNLYNGTRALIIFNITKIKTA